MARDDEFRKAAEDIRALARSLGRDFREAVDQSVRGGASPGRAVRHGLQGLRDEARHGMRTGWGGRRGHWRGGPWGYWRYWGCGGDWGGAPGSPPTSPGGEPGAPGSEFAGSPPGGAPPWVRGRPWMGPGGGPPAGIPWAGPTRNRPGRQRAARPPIRHRWDATTVLGMLAVLFGVSWLIGATGVLHVSIEAVVAVGLMLLGASLVVTGRTDWSLSRRSWPVWLGVGLIALLVATSSTFGIGNAFSSVSFGTITPSINAASPPSGTVHGGFGDLRATVTGQPKVDETIKVVSVAGRTTVTFDPTKAKYNVAINARVGAGEICVNGVDTADGVGASVSNRPLVPVGNPGAGSRTLTLDVHQMFGQIVIGGRGCGH